MSVRRKAALHFRLLENSRSTTAEQNLIWHWINLKKALRCVWCLTIETKREHLTQDMGEKNQVISSFFLLIFKTPPATIFPHTALCSWGSAQLSLLLRSKMYLYTTEVSKKLISIFAAFWFITAIIFNYFSYVANTLAMSVFMTVDEHWDQNTTNPNITTMTGCAELC